ncbi:MAG: hypothetical protein ACFB21_10170 [Opitutales bacterium]
MSNLPTQHSLRKGRFTLIAIVSTVLFVLSLAAWIINLAVTFGAMSDDSPLGFLGADRSTVSTLVFVLAFLFPMWKAIRYIVGQSKDPDAAVERLDTSPYPPNFVFFLVMLGLTGTLFGLLIGINPGEIRSVAGEATAAETGQVINNLLVGAATALLSSLWALIVAFLAASPFREVWEWAAALPVKDEDLTLSQVLQQLTSDLRSLSAANREMLKTMPAPGSTPTTPTSASGGETVEAGLARTNELLERLEATMAQQLAEERRNRERFRQALAVLAGE